jgi:heme/copper-type cytochrome/quinol oxidase subunit 2
MPAEFWWKFTAIVLIAASLLATLVWELRKPKRDPNEDPDTKRMNDMLRD